MVKPVLIAVVDKEDAQILVCSVSALQATQAETALFGLVHSIMLG